MNPKVLLVDDDPNILSAYTRLLHRRFDLQTAQGGTEGLALLKTSGPYAVILSDMRMPVMDGVQFLAEARSRAPESVRIMLTGNADLDTAIQAVNRGHIFRFLTKPCAQPLLVSSIEAGIKQYRLVLAEKELVEGTVKGSIDLLVQLLSLADPIAFRQGQRLGRLSRKVARVMEMEADWVVLVASLLAPIGVLTIPGSVLAKARKGDPITPREHETLLRLPEIGAKLLGHIPRMEEVAQVILFRNKNFNGSGFPPVQVHREGIPLGARILRAVSDYLDVMERRSNPRLVLEEMRQNQVFYDPRVINALELALEVPDEIVDQGAASSYLATHQTVQIGELLVEGVYTREGHLVYPAGTVIGQSHQARLRNYAALVGLKEPFPVEG
ncbi:HD domain-containing phosphohydrolase [Mesoterricola silvestris]|uniref:Response regulator receiver modulated metal-depenent phosphohydrolase n=1 Tax=Mesoterricola silvestris TaxID=2927979 RepID=A0AA48K9V3_9BACT|nr:HD domain-containing phosphohydrolase [Mesoterricola silvestris]BDU73460.1 response regulator receiver modulated metal-depenent phosphohydrolase [Mesoterricola silvestris]